MEGEGKLKAPRREHLKALARSGDVEAEAELASIPKLHPLAAHVWTWFSDLNLTRGSGGMGIARITRLEIRAWEEDEGHRLQPWERKAILSIDAAYVASNYAEASPSVQEQT